MNAVKPYKAVTVIRVGIQTSFVLEHYTDPF